MGTLHKAFEYGEIVEPSDLNDGVNPSTADHLAAATWAGYIRIPLNGSQTVVTQRITFPAGRFSQKPIVVASGESVQGGSAPIQVRTDKADKSGVTIALTSATGAKLKTNYDFIVNVIAVQMNWL